jgi:hypothetical protein
MISYVRAFFSTLKKDPGNSGRMFRCVMTVIVQFFPYPNSAAELLKHVFVTEFHIEEEEPDYPLGQTFATVMNKYVFT